MWHFGITYVGTCTRKPQKQNNDKLTETKDDSRLQKNMNLLQVSSYGVTHGEAIIPNKQVLTQCVHIVLKKLTYSNKKISPTIKKKNNGLKNYIRNNE